MIGWHFEVGQILSTNSLARQSLRDPIGNMTKPDSDRTLTSSGGDGGIGVEATGTLAVAPGELSSPRKSNERHAA